MGNAQTAILNIGTNLGEWNLGMMTALQMNPTDTTTNCYVACTATNVAIVDTLDIANYPSGSFDFFTLFDTW